HPLIAPQLGDERDERGQDLDAQRPLSRLPATIGRILRQRHAPQRPALAHVDTTRADATNEQHLQPLAPQRMKRMDDDQRTQSRPARPRGMRWRSESPTRAARPPAWE